jgi:hypothetical protein
MTNQAVQPPAANPELAHISRRFPAWRTLPFSKTIVLVLRRRPSFSASGGALIVLVLVIVIEL